MIEIDIMKNIYVTIKVDSILVSKRYIDINSSLGEGNIFYIAVETSEGTLWNSRVLI